MKWKWVFMYLIPLSVDSKFWFFQKHLDSKMVAVWKKINISAQFFHLQQTKKLFLIQFLVTIAFIRPRKLNILLFSRRYMWIGSFDNALERPTRQKILFSEKGIQSLKLPVPEPADGSAQRAVISKIFHVWKYPFTHAVKTCSYSVTATFIAINFHRTIM